MERLVNRFSKLLDIRLYCDVIHNLPKLQEVIKKP